MKTRSARSALAAFRRTVSTLTQLVEQYEPGTTLNHLRLTLDSSKMLVVAAEQDLNPSTWPTEGPDFGELWLDIGGEVQSYLNTNRYSLEEVADWYGITPDQASKMHAMMY